MTHHYAFQVMVEASGVLTQDAARLLDMVPLVVDSVQSMVGVDVVSTRTVAQLLGLAVTSAKSMVVGNDALSRDAITRHGRPTDSVMHIVATIKSAAELSKTRLATVGLKGVPSISAKMVRPMPVLRTTVA